MSIITDEMVAKAYDAYRIKWQGEDESMARALQAVANDFIEACASVCDARAKECWGQIEEESASEDCAVRIRSLKIYP